MEKQIKKIIYKYIGYLSKTKAKKMFEEILALAPKLKEEQKGDVQEITTKSGSKAFVANPYE